VIMLILAGITINLTLGENGIFQKAKQAKEKWQQAEQKENEELSTAFGDFRLYANGSTLYKLYENGDLYGRGNKGNRLNTSVKEMEKINSYKWGEYNIPSEVQGCKKVIISMFGDSLFFIDKDDELWACGSNSNNIFGLDNDQLTEYNQRNTIKLDVAGKKVKNAWIGSNSASFIVTTDNKIYVAGSNQNGELGLGEQSPNQINSFTEVKIEGNSNSKDIKDIQSYANLTIIQFNDNTFYYAGKHIYSNLGSEYYTTKTEFTKFWDGVGGGIDIDGQVKQIVIASAVMVVLDNGKLITEGDRYNYLSNNNSLETCENGYGDFKVYTALKDKFVEKVYLCRSSAGCIIEVNEQGGTKAYYKVGNPDESDLLGSNSQMNNTISLINFPQELVNEGIKEIFTIENGVYILTNESKVWFAGGNSYSGTNNISGYTENFIYTGLNNIETLYDSKIKGNSLYNCVVIPKASNGKYYMTGSSRLMFKNRIVENDWIKVASNVKSVAVDGCAYIDKDNNLWIAGGDSKALGLGEKSETSIIINNFEKCTDSNILGKAKEVKSSSYGTVVLTTDNKLFATGYYNIQNANMKAGWVESEDKSTFVEIADNVKIFDILDYQYGVRAYITNDNKMFFWGFHNGKVCDDCGSKITVPTENKNINTIVANKDIIKIDIMGGVRSNILTSDGKVYRGGYSSAGYDGGEPISFGISSYTYNLPNEKITDVVSISANSSIFLTEKGDVYGFGPENKLGINSGNTTKAENRKLPISNVKSIIAGSFGYIAIKNDGTVWATGDNSNGILGKWKKENGELTESSYDTPITWVQCPDLEGIEF
ncbi:MAG: hypothetical protein Q4G05_06775, partial [Clostridia bacterium]|nr:hypothetical protein [Clostridia bacterium]